MSHKETAVRALIQPTHSEPWPGGVLQYIWYLLNRQKEALKNTTNTSCNSLSPTDICANYKEYIAKK